MRTVNLVFPHQLFEKSPITASADEVFIIEEYLFFRQYAFHKQKIAWHRASMKFYESFLKSTGKKVAYIESIDPISDIRKLLDNLGKRGISRLQYIDPADDWLERRLNLAAKRNGIELKVYPSPLFLNKMEQLADFFQAEKKQYSQTSFYIEQRKKRNVLLEKDKKPLGGKWTFDDENRKRFPAGKNPPVIAYPETTDFYREAINYAERNFPENPGQLTDNALYPDNFAAAKKWFNNFLQTRFAEFGPYEDAIVAKEGVLNHSLLSPLLNTGLLTPDEVLQDALEYVTKSAIPLNSAEGFIRQIIGWREFIHGIYRFRGRNQRTRNFWGFKRKIPKSFYDGSTGIEPVDITIKKVLKTGYCHHIERLMVLGNFMLLCEFDPDEVYRWFMELFIDAFDWVMVPNIYGMSQFADGGLMATKPYIGGSNYLKKMSDYTFGEWQTTWDGLFWRFMHVHRAFFLQNPRLGMLVRSFDKMPAEKQRKHLEAAEKFLLQLDG